VNLVRLEEIKKKRSPPSCILFFLCFFFVFFWVLKKNKTSFLLHFIDVVKEKKEKQRIKGARTRKKLEKEKKRKRKEKEKEKEIKRSERWPHFTSGNGFNSKWNAFVPSFTEFFLGLTRVGPR